MKVLGLDGNEYRWKLASSTDRASRSKGHLRCRSLLERLFPADVRLEEVPLPGSGKLAADFYLPHRKLLIEVHGRQHREFVGHFHRHPSGFLKSLGRDQKKKEWCEINGIRYVGLHDRESDAEWERRILQEDERAEAG